MLLHEDEHNDLNAVKMSVRGKDVLIGDERLIQMLPKLQKRKREILLMYYLLEMTLDEIADELGLEYETVKSTKSNHGPEFTAVLDEFMPYWRDIRKELNDSTLDYLPDTM